MSITHFITTMSAAPKEITITVTEGQITFPFVVNGFSSRATSFGSIDVSTLNGIEIKELSTAVATGTITVYLDGNVPQNHFTDVLFEDGSVLTSASATYAYNAAGDDTTSWVWTIAPPARWDGSGSSTVIFNLP